MASNGFSLASKVKVSQQVGDNTMVTHSSQLPSGNSMPQIQLGLYMMSGREVLSAVPWALAAGYRGFDSAQMYHNEAEAGKAILTFLDSPENPGLKREDIFYTSKLASNSTSYSSVRRSIKKSVEACGLGFIDLFLLHSPYGGPESRLTSWKAVEDAIEDGEIKSGGVSNYGVKHVRQLAPVDQYGANRRANRLRS
jgi:diketogulonate reductase-like aldo/keto reductase